jgi:hypothetical protein
VTLRLVDPLNELISNSTISNSSNYSEDIDHNANKVILFVRMEQCNYCCLGQVKFIAMNLTVHPIQIKWQLVDYDRIMQNQLSRDYFNEILAAAHCMP